MDCKGSKKDEALKSMILKLSYKLVLIFPPNHATAPMDISVLSQPGIETKIILRL